MILFNHGAFSRPRLDDTDRRDLEVKVRFNATEYRDIARLARAHGLPRATLVRMTVRHALLGKLSLQPPSLTPASVTSPE